MAAAENGMGMGGIGGMGNWAAGGMKEGRARGTGGRGGGGMEKLTLIGDSENGVERTGMTGADCDAAD